MSTGRSWIVVTLSYLAIVLALWLPFDLHSGLPYETGLVYTSEISTWWNGFLNGSDHLRIYTSIFYQAAYLMGELSGFAGSFVPYQIVYAVLWWARGFLFFLIGRRLLPGRDMFWYVVGALLLVHSSDEAVGWVGQLNQFGFMFWLLAAFYMLLVAFEQTGRLRILLYLVTVAVFEHLSLWSYEGQIAVACIAPLLLLGQQRFRRRWFFLAGVWYVVPVIYIAVAMARYARSGGYTYEQSVLRKTWSAGVILSDWLFNISASLRFWTWPGAQPAKVPASALGLAATLAVASFLAGMALLVRLRREKDSGWIPARRTLWAALFAGLALLVSSFPVYVMLESARSLWRTQILSGFGAALALGAAIGLCASYARKTWLQVGTIAVLAALVTGYGSYGALKKGAFHRAVWERHRTMMAQVLGVAPRLEPGTLVILTGVPKDKSRDPFLGDNMWFDMALRLAYPGTRVAGVYFFEDGQAAPGANLKITPSGEWSVRGGFYQAAGSVSAILVLACNAQGSVLFAQTLPGFLGVDKAEERLYNPRARIENGSPSPRAVRRYIASGSWSPAAN